MKGGRRQFGWLALLYIIFVCSQALASSAWTLRRPLPTVNHLGGLASGDGRYVAVGNHGTIIVSPDGTNWASAPSHVETTLIGVTHGEKGFVAVGENGTVLRSIHGNGWVKCDTTTQALLIGVTYGGGRYVAVGEKIVSSKDAIHWSTATNYYALPLVGVAYANGLFVAVAHGKSVTSEDGLTWTTHSQADPNFRYLHDIIYAGGRFLAGADQCVATSIDGTNWVTTRYLNRSLMRLAYGNGNYIGLDIDSQFIHTSQDGETWTGYYLPNPGWVERLTFVNDQFFALGLGGEIMTSSNGMEWARQGQGDSRHLYGVAHGPGEYVAVGEAGTILCSARGDSWSSVGVDTMDNLNCVAYGGKKFVAGGDWGTLLTSTDGTNWLAQEPLGFRQIKSIAYGEGRFVVVGTDGGALAYESTDGVTWNIADYHWNSVYTGIAYGNGRFVAFLCSNYGPYPWVQVSKDGVDWITPEPNFEGYSGVGLVAFGSGHFVAPGNYGDIYTSENGTKWVRRRVKELAYETALSISYGAGKFFITEESGLVVSSPNGIVWTEEKTGSDARLYDMAYGGENCVAVGEYGVILQSHISPTIPDSHLRRQSPVFSARRFMSDSETSISGRSGQQYSPAPVRRQSKDDVRSGD